MQVCVCMRERECVYTCISVRENERSMAREKGCLFLFLFITTPTRKADVEAFFL